LASPFITRDRLGLSVYQGKSEGTAPSRQMTTAGREKDISRQIIFDVLIRKEKRKKKKRRRRRKQNKNKQNKIKNKKK